MAYQVEKNWYVMELIRLIGIMYVVCYLWFGFVWSIAIVAPYGWYCYKIDRKNYMQKQNFKLRVEFKDFLVLLSGNLTAGYALEGAFSQTLLDMNKQYGENFLIKRGIEKCVYGIHINQGIEVMFEGFADSVGIEDIADCARLLALSKRYGGNMISMIKRVADNISSVLSVEKEIETMEAQKKLEGKIMLLAPFGIVAYMRFTNPGYLDFMYNTIGGHVIMAVTLFVIAMVGAWMNRILTIK